MNDWERQANASLRALGEAYRQGGIGRETYRARRRRLFATLRESQAITQRRQPPSAIQDAPARMLLASRRGSFASWRFVLALFVVALAIFFGLWNRGQGHV